MPVDTPPSAPPETAATSVVTRRRRKAAPSEDAPVEAVPPAPEPAEEVAAEVAPAAAPTVEDVLAAAAPRSPERTIEAPSPPKKRNRGPVARVLTPDEAAARVAAQMDADMAELLASGGGMADLKPGDRVRGKVLALLADRLVVDVKGPQDGWVPVRELLGDDGNLLVGVGDELELRVVSIDGEGVRLSWGAVRAQIVSEELESAYRDRLVVRGTVVGHNKGGLEVKVQGRRAFCPASQVDRDFSEDLSAHVGQSYTFLITKYDPTGRRTVVSRRAALEREAQALAAETRQKLEPGAVLEGTVRKLMDFGAFVDVGGLDGLVHVSEIAWDRIEKPGDVLAEGQTVLVKVLKLDGGRDRIALSIRQAQGDPWADVAERFEVGRSYAGKVTRLTEFGAFVELASGVEGLVHVSEIDWKRIRRPDDVLKAGDETTVRVLELDGRRRRLALSIRQATDDPWSTAADRIVPGTEIEVVVESVADFGVFCTIADGVTGLMPNSMTNTSRGANLKRLFKVGSTIKVFVNEVDRRQRKITLSRNEGSEGGASDYKAYLQQKKREESDGLSALALALKGALEK